MNVGDDLAFVIPLWKRTRNVERVYGAVRATTPGARILFVVSADDDPVRGELSRLSLLTDRNALVVDWPGGSHGDYAKKINAGYRATDEPMIFTGADDVIPTPGWYDEARQLIGNPVGVVGTVDNCNPRTRVGAHSTHSLVARWWADCCAVIDRPGAVYCELYSHEYCDDELVRSAMFRDAYVHAFESIVEHEHPWRHPELDDDTYRHGRAQTRRNGQIFRRRRHLWGDGRPGRRQQYPRRPEVTRR